VSSGSGLPLFWVWARGDCCSPPPLSVKKKNFQLQDDTRSVTTPTQVTADCEDWDIPWAYAIEDPSIFPSEAAVKVSVPSSSTQSIVTMTSTAIITVMLIAADNMLPLLPPTSSPSPSPSLLGPTHCTGEITAASRRSRDRFCTHALGHPA
jgi:hypothetical protein